MRQSIPKENKKTRDIKIKYEVEQMQKEEVARMYETKIEELLEERGGEEEKNVEDSWKEIEETICQAARKILKSNKEKKQPGPFPDRGYPRSGNFN